MDKGVIFLSSIRRGRSRSLIETVQGIVRGLSDYIRIEEIHFTQLRRRILKIKPTVGILNLDIEIPLITLPRLPLFP
jgi:hypothetical protein